MIRFDVVPMYHRPPRWYYLRLGKLWLSPCLLRECPSDAESDDNCMSEPVSDDDSCGDLRSTGTRMAGFVAGPDNIHNYIFYSGERPSYSDEHPLVMSTTADKQSPPRM
jgi:hypothetical protein